MALRHWSYVDRGRYAVQLERWFAVMPRERFLVLPAEQLVEQPERAYAAVLGFLGLKPFEPACFEARNANRYPAGTERVRARLERMLTEDNERLFELLGRRLWDEAPGAAPAGR